MAANAFTLYEQAKRYLAAGVIDMDTNTISARLAKNDSNASTSGLSLSSEITNWVSTGGASAQTLTIAFDENGSSVLVSADNLVWTASAADMTSVQFLVITDGTNDKAICWAALSTANFTVTNGNTLTVSLSGLFSMD